MMDMLKSGMFRESLILNKRKNVITIPEEALGLKVLIIWYTK